ncbi:MAG TPA: TetR/AcrR family transcriptional regulator [Candidatus Acidoferrum sp.]|nr:TetR/AcrR family transcriptional regulator [Candidatus Acidoferrum sp.]
MLHSDCAKLDPRIRRTRGLLQDALQRLLEEKDFDKITIQDIAEAATLNRATFYAHYPDKFALLEEWIRVSFLQLLECRKIRFDGSCATAFNPVILAVCDYLAELQKSRASKQRQFEAFVEGTVIDQIRIILIDGYKKHPTERSIDPELIAATASWAIYGAAKQWVNNPDRPSSEDFVTTALDLVRPILTAGSVPAATS